MHYKTITKEIFDSYIANDSDTVLEGAVTNTFGNTTFWRFVRVPLAKGEHYVEALYAQSSFSFPLAMGVNHFSIKNGLEFMAFIIHLVNVSLLPKTKGLFLHKLVDHQFS